MDAWAQQDVRRGDTVAWPTNLGWMMGPWLLYAALLNGAAIALFQVPPMEAQLAPGTPLLRPLGACTRWSSAPMACRIAARPHFRTGRQCSACLEPGQQPAWPSKSCS